MSSLLTEIFLKMSPRISIEEYKKLIDDCKTINCSNTMCSQCKGKSSCMKLRRCELTGNKPYGY